VCIRTKKPVAARGRHMTVTLLTRGVATRDAPVVNLVSVYTKLINFYGGVARI